MQNELLKNPVKVAIFDPRENEVLRTFVFLGAVPKNVAAHVVTPRAGSEKSLESWYGEDYKEKLAMTPPRIVGGTDDPHYEPHELQLPRYLPVDAIVSTGADAIGGAVSSVHSQLHPHSHHQRHIRVEKIGENRDGSDKIWTPDHDVLEDARLRGDKEIMVRWNWKKDSVRDAARDAVRDTIDAVDTDTSHHIRGGAVAPAPGMSGSTSLTKDVDLSDIEQLLHRTREKKVIKRTTFSRGVEYVESVHVFPEDKLSEIKDKIFLVTDIPTYRQHLFYLTQDGPVTPYTLNADGVHTIDIRMLAGDSTDETTQHKVLGIPIDKTLYELRHVMKIEALDQFTLVRDCWQNEGPAPMTFFVTDLAFYSDRIRTQLSDITRDTYQFELFYYGFIVKYWPQLTLECFRDFAISEHELQHKYPELSRQKSQLAPQYRNERDIITRNYALAAHPAKKSDQVSFAIIGATGVINNPRTLINIRNLFDKLRVSRCIPEIHAHVENVGRKYLLRKKHISNGSDIPFPVVQVMKTGITIAISLRKSDQDSFHTKSTSSTMGNEQSRYMFLNIWPSGRCNIKTVWSEEDEVNFDILLQHMQTVVHPILTKINMMGKAVFSAGSKLSMLSAGTITYTGLNVCVFWKRVMMPPSFKIARGFWENYMRAKITSPRNVQQLDKYEFTFRKGMHEFDPQLIEKIVTSSNNIILMNHYAHLSVDAVRQKWDQNYEGRVVRMIHRTTDIRFEILDIREREFETFKFYVECYVRFLGDDPEFQESFVKQRDTGTIKRLRKLKEQDPELFNLKKYGSKRGYSELCQNPRQPLVYTDDEIARLPDRDVKRLVKYWNFTLKRPAYYGCPSKKFPHLKFLIGKHPKGYCLPCCNTKSLDDEENKSSQVTIKCLRDHVFLESNRDISKHVMAYGKDIDDGRLSKIPNSIKNLLFGTLDGGSGANYYMVGVHQILAEGYFGFAFAIADALEMALGDLVAELTAGVSREKMYYTLYSGALSEFFPTEEDFLTTLREVFSGKQVLRETKKFSQWAEVFIEMLMGVKGVATLTFIDEDGSGESVDLFTTGHDVLASDRFIILVRRLNKYYPINILDPAKYFRDFHSQRTFTQADRAVQLLSTMVKHAHAEDLSVGKMIDYRFLRFAHEAGVITIAKKLVNKHNKCFAVMVTLGKSAEAPSGTSSEVSSRTLTYIPCNYSTVVADDAEPQFTWPDMMGTWQDCVAVVAAINVFIAEKFSVVGSTMFAYAKISPAKLLSVGGKCYGFNDSHANYYFQRVDPGDFAGASIFVGVPYVDTIYDMQDVNKDIYTPREADPRMKKLSGALYNNYVYQLYLVEFVSWLSKSRNDGVRKEVISAVRDKDPKIRLRAILKQFPTDYSLVLSQLGAFYRHREMQTLIQQLTETTYEFDKVKFNELRSLPREELVKSLREISREFVVERPEFDASGIEFPNIYMPCADSGAGHCDGNHLIVRSVKTLVEILADDMKNELKSRYIIDNIYMDIVVDFLNFTRVPTEHITVYKIY